LFSFSLGGTDETSKVIFGSYDLKRFSDNNSNLDWIKLVDDQYWTIGIARAKLGNYVFDLDTSQAIIDTGTSYILMPPNDFAEFKKVIEPGRNCYIDTSSGLFTCSCYTSTHADFPDFHITLGENSYYTIPSTSYMQR